MLIRMDNYSITMLLTSAALFALYGVAMWQNHQRIKRKRGNRK